MNKTILTLLFIIVTTTAQADIVNIAKNEIGNGELGGNNKGKHVQKYNKGLEAAWCAGFVSWVLATDGYRSLTYSRSAKAIYNEAKKKNMTVTNPKRGDLIVFWRESPKSWKGHIGIVEKVSNGKIYTIEGNVGKFPSKVSRFNYDINDIPRLLGFVRL